MAKYEKKPQRTSNKAERNQNPEVHHYAGELTRTLNRYLIVPKEAKQLVVDKFLSNPFDVVAQSWLEHLNLLVRKGEETESVRRKRAQDRVSDIIPLLNSWRPLTVLDVGGADGYILEALGQKLQLPRTDLYVLEVQSFTNDQVTYLKWENNQIPLEESSVDLVLMNQFMHHISRAELMTCLAEINRVLTPNGRIVIREHDALASELYYNFLQLIHYFWYHLNREEIAPLNLLSAVQVSELFKFFEWTCLEQTRYNPLKEIQRRYYAVYVRRGLVYLDDRTAVLCEMLKPEVQEEMVLKIRKSSLEYPLILRVADVEPWLPVPYREVITLKSKVKTVRIPREGEMDIALIYGLISLDIRLRALFHVTSNLSKLEFDEWFWQPNGERRLRSLQPEQGTKRLSISDIVFEYRHESFRNGIVMLGQFLELEEDGKGTLWDE